MQKGYEYPRTKCLICGDMIADNWYVRHMREEHTLHYCETVNVQEVDMSSVTPRPDGRFDVRIRAVTNVMTKDEALDFASEIIAVCGGSLLVERLREALSEPDCGVCDLPHKGVDLDVMSMGKMPTPYRTNDGTCPHCKQPVPDLCDFGQAGEVMARICPHCSSNVTIVAHITYIIEREPKTVSGYCMVCGEDMLVWETDSHPMHARCIEIK
jgi:hypothetical protein